MQKLSQESREGYIRAYSGSEALRGGFLHYRVFAQDAQQLESMFAMVRLQQKHYFWAVAQFAMRATDNLGLSRSIINLSNSGTAVMSDRQNNQKLSSRLY